MPTSDQLKEKEEQAAQFADPDDGDSFTENLEDQYDFTDPSLDDRSAEEESKDESDVSQNAESQDESSQEDEATQFSAELISRASVLGLNESEMGQFPSAEKLETTLDLMDRAIVNDVVDDADKPGVEDTSASESDHQQEETKYEFGVEEDLLDADTVKALKFMQDKHSAQVGDLQKSLNSVTSALTQQRQAQFTEWVDEKFKGLDDSWEKTFGKQPGNKMNQKSPEFSGRIKILNAMDALSRVHNPNDRDGLFERALRAEFGEKIEANVRQEVADGKDQRRSQALSRPNSRKAIEVKASREQTAISNLSVKLKSLGMSGDESAPEEF